MADVESFCSKHSEDINKLPMGFYESLNEFFDTKLPDAEELITGLRRGEVAELAAVTNYGKSTLLLNLCLSLASGQKCLPLLGSTPKPRHVVYVDCESPASSLKADLQNMLRQVTDINSAKKNFTLMVDAEIQGVPLNLSQELHFKKLMASCKKHRPDLIVIDTISSAFELSNENDNAEVARRVMKPLKKLARALNCAVIFAHHIGKVNETQSGEGAYRGRGGSNFGALSRMVITLEKDSKHGEGYIALKCTKGKGSSIEPALLKLNQHSRWFEVCSEKPTHKSTKLMAQDIEKLVAQKECTTTQIVEHFKDLASERKIKGLISEAKNRGLIEKDSRKSLWRSCKSQKGNSEQATLNPVEASTNGLVQACKSIRSCTLALTET